MLSGLFLDLHKLGETGHCQHLIDFRADVGHLKLTLLLHDSTHGFLDDTQT